MRRFDTSIKDLVKAQCDYTNTHGTTPIFLSDWDASFSEISFPSLDFGFSYEEAQKYYYWTDEMNNKNSFQKYIFDKYNYNLQLDRFALSNNGTSSLFLAMMTLYELGVKNILVFSPAYFTLLNILDTFNFHFFEYKMPLEITSIDYEDIKNIIKNNNIDAMVLTNPLFGTGVEINEQIVKELAQLANIHDIWFLMDYIYGGMPWNTSNKQIYIFNFTMYQAISKAEKYIFIESISKRLFLNGTKFSFVFSNPRMIRRILRLSIFSIGSMSVVQAKLSNRVYEPTSERGIIMHIEDNLNIAKHNFDMIKTILSDTSAKITKTNCGYFTLVSMPNNQLANDMDIAVKLIKRYGIMTTPHSRYLYVEPNYYSFRVNLLLNKNSLFKGINVIKELFNE